ncbi:MAG: hypothetical protein M1832_001184 [Thelocarpon impressellum]|nr:MAG: hypothetical protein M1832_001184 [Thelocarpon impressellum]
MAAVALQVEGRGDVQDPEVLSEEDAEHELDPMLDIHMFAGEGGAPPINLDGSAGDLGADLDADSEVDKLGNDAEGEQDDDGDVVGPVKMPGKKVGSVSEDDDEEPTSADDSGSDSDSDSDKPSSAGDSDAEAEWEEGSDGGEEGDAEVLNPNRCIFCGGDEENDPSEDFEEYLACAPDYDAESWRCPTCIDNALEPDATEEDTLRRRTSAPKITRDLLPAQRGTSRPDSHSVFNQLIVNEDPLDGSRMLRKRKASPDDADEALPASTKRQRQMSESGASAASVAAGDDNGENHEARLTKDAAVEEFKGEEDADGPEEESETPRPASRSSRPRRPKKVRKPAVTVLRKQRRSLVLSFNLDANDLTRILQSAPKRRRRRPGQTLSSHLEHSHPFSAAYSSQYATPFYSFHERENDELKSKPYGGILGEADADTSKTLPDATDRERFEDARKKAEEEWKQKVASSSVGDNVRQKVAGPASKIQCINFGGYEIDTWYAAPYPEEYSRNRVLYICEFCLKYMSSEYVAWRHKLKCPAKHPPGDEIYRDGSVSVFEVDGRKDPVYCQNLCLLAKLFLGSKTLYYDVEPFLFYVMTEYDELGCHFVGYFSKEKRPSSSNNVSCILTLPIHQRKGYGNLLIDFSYLLTRVEHKTGSPEKPLSDMGLVSYRNYWRLVLSYVLRDQKEPLTVTDISERTGMTADDIISALEGLRALVRDPVTGTYALRLDYRYFHEYIGKWEAKGYVRLNPGALVWTPYIMGRSNLAHFESAPPLATVAPREGEEDIKDLVAAEEGVQMAVVAAAVKKEEQKGKEALVNGHDVDKDVESPDSTLLTPGMELDRQLEVTSAATRLSPAKSSLRAQTPVNGNGHVEPTPSTPPIPPTRFEIFPPLPGSVKRNGGGGASARLTSARRQQRLGTPSGSARDRRPRDSQHAMAALGNGKTLFKQQARATRSKVADVDGAADEPEQEQEADGARAAADGFEDAHPNDGSDQAAVDDAQAQSEVLEGHDGEGGA